MGGSDWQRISLMTCVENITETVPWVRKDMINNWTLGESGSSGVPGKMALEMPSDHMCPSSTTDSDPPSPKCPPGMTQLRFCHLCGRETWIGYWAANTSPDLPGWCRYLGNEALGKGTREPGNLPLYRTHSCSILLITLVPLILSKLSNKKTNF